MSRLRFAAGGGRPPASHEVLLLEDGDAWYVTGMPWPAQPPFDEIGAYRGPIEHQRAGALRELARACLAAAPAPSGPADTGLETVELDGARVHWNPAERPEPMQRLVAAARELIGPLRHLPVCALRGELKDGHVRLMNPGERALPLRDGRITVGWGRSTRPPSPFRLLQQAPVPAGLPAALEPGDGVELALPRALPSPEPETFDTPYALVHLRWRPPIEGEGDELDGWVIAGP